MILPNIDSASPVSRPAAADTDRAELSSLVTRAAAGVHEAQVELVARYTRRISGFVRSIVRQPEAVEDVTQTVFIKMFRRLGGLRDNASFESWLFMMARTTSLDFLRRQQRRIATVSVDDQLFEVADTSHADTSAEIMEALEGALQQLPAQTRTLVTLFIQGNSYETLAAREGLTLGAVKARLHRARPVLRECVGAVIQGRSFSAPSPLLAGMDRGRVAA